MAARVRERFQSVECACTWCKVGCRTMPGALALGDFEEIVAARFADSWKANGGNVSDAGAQEIRRFALDHFDAYAFVAEVEHAGADAGGAEAAAVHVTLEIAPSIVPKMTTKPDGSRACVFLDASGACAIHAVKPFGCAKYKTCPTPPEDDERTDAATREWERELTGTLRRTERPSPDAEAYLRVWNYLHDHGQLIRAHTMEGRKHEFRTAIDRLDAADDRLDAAEAARAVFEC